MIEVKLLTKPDFIKEMVNIATRAGLTCTANTDKLNAPNYDCVDFLKRRIEQGHESVIEHINLSFEIRGISRALLQELARHRHISLSVESTRWTLKKANMIAVILNLEERAETLLRTAPNDPALQEMCDLLRDDLAPYLTTILSMVKAGCGSDIMKYFLPELYPTNLVMTLNLRELRHIYKLRSKPPALQEFQDLCAAIKSVLPEEIVTLLEVKNDE